MDSLLIAKCRVCRCPRCRVRHTVASGTRLFASSFPLVRQGGRGETRKTQAPSLTAWRTPFRTDVPQIIVWCNNFVIYCLRPKWINYIIVLYGRNGFQDEAKIKRIPVYTNNNIMK